MSTSVPAPVGGLNYRDSAAAMPKVDAIRMVNFVPLPYALALRKGWQQWQTGLGTLVETVACHKKNDGTSIVIAAAGGNVWALSAPGAVSTPDIDSQLSNYWQTQMMSNDAGTFTYMVNGMDKPQVYDGTIFTEVSESMTNPPPDFDIYGADPTGFINVTLHQRRLWFVMKDSLDMYYLPPNNIGGEVALFPLGPVMDRGGHLVAMATWTLDAGQGMDDYCAFISSEGQIAVYTGADPDDISSFTLQGVFTVGSPVGYRCWTKYGGDVLLLTRDGLVPMSIALQSTRVNSRINLTDKIQNRISALVSAYGTLHGWQTFVYPNENQIWVLVPIPDAVSIFSMNTITGAWTEYIGFNAACICLLDNDPLFGDRSGTLGLAWQGYQDNAPWNGDPGEVITAEAVTAYNYFDETGRQKRWVMTRPILQSQQVPAYAIGMLIDFIYSGVPSSLSSGDTLTPPSSSVIQPPSGSGGFDPGEVASSSTLWNTAIWNQSFWPQSSLRYRNWLSVGGIGYCAALSLTITAYESVLWTASDFVYELGAIV